MDGFWSIVVLLAWLSGICFGIALGDALVNPRWR